MKYLSIDIETTGLCPRSDSILEVAAVFEDTDANIPVEQLPYIHLVVGQDYDRYTVTPYTARLHARLWDQLLRFPHSLFVANREQACPSQALRLNDNPLGSSCYCYTEGILPALAAFAQSQGLTGKVNVAGKNFASFDRQFLVGNYDPYYEDKPALEFRHRTLDPSVLFLEAGDAELPSTDTCMKRAGLTPTDSHSAYGDAIDVIRLLRIGLRKDGRSLT